jgi:hypothetical protein
MNIHLLRSPELNQETYRNIYCSNSRSMHFLEWGGSTAYNSVREKENSEIIKDFET